MAARLVVHADDFGETVEITRGIAEAIAAGAVTSTTIMANMPGTEFALGEARRLGDRASFGVHLNFCEGRPLTQCASLTGATGAFLSKRRLFLRAAAGRLDPGEVRAEVDAQIERVAAAGIRVSHVDGHKHLHQLPGVAVAVAAACRVRKIERVRRTVTCRLGKPSVLVREILARRAGRVFTAAGLRFPQRVVDLQDLMVGDLAAAGLLGGGGILEIFCHPGTVAADAEKPGSCARSQELTYLLSPRWRHVLAASGRKLATYWEV